ncbi:MAG: DKNYY domain-containing protein [Vibrio sp.]
MKLVINIIVTFALCWWPLILMMSPMMFDAPDSENDKSVIIGGLVFMSYPVILFALLGIFGADYFGMNSWRLAAVSTAIIALSFTVFGYTSLLSNAMRGIPSSGYGVVDDQVYYNARPIAQADAASFHAFQRKEFGYLHSAELYAKDAHHLYYQGKVVPNVDVTDVEGKILGSDLYWLTELAVIYQDKAITGADPKSFQPFKQYSSWASSGSGDDKHIFYRHQMLEDVDVATFEPIYHSYAKDRQHIYYGRIPILQEADPAHFELLDEYVARDEHAVYFLNGENSHPIADATAQEFTSLGRNYYKSNDRIFYIEAYQAVHLLEDIDAQTFEVTDYDSETHSDARDAEHWYLSGQRVAR